MFERFDEVNLPGRNGAQRTSNHRHVGSDVAVFIDGLRDRDVEFSIRARVADYLTDPIRPCPTTLGSQRSILMASPATARRSPCSIPRANDGRPARERSCREHPHPGAQLRLWDHAGWRHQAVITNSAGEAHLLERRHRQHAEMENHIRNLNACGAERMPFTRFTANQVWFETILTAADPSRFAQILLLDSDLARVETKTLR